MSGGVMAGDTGAATLTEGSQAVAAEGIRGSGAGAGAGNSSGANSGANSGASGAIPVTTLAGAGVLSQAGAAEVAVAGASDLPGDRSGGAPGQNGDGAPGPYGSRHLDPGTGRALGSTNGSPGVESGEAPGLNSGWTPGSNGNPWVGNQVGVFHGQMRHRRLLCQHQRLHPSTMIRLKVVRRRVYLGLLRGGRGGVFTPPDWHLSSENYRCGECVSELTGQR
ncbi:unnamed protein product [Discosporangium mesarthrocarpum]